MKFFGKKKSKKFGDDASVVSATPQKPEPSMAPVPVVHPPPMAPPQQPVVAPMPPQAPAVPVSSTAATDVASVSKRSVTSKTRSVRSSRKSPPSAVPQAPPQQSRRAQREPVEEKRGYDEQLRDGQESRDEIFENRDACDPHSHDEASFAEDAPSMEDAMSGEDVSVGASTVETYEDEGTDIHTRESDVETYENDLTQNGTYDGSVAASEAVGNQKKFFHKDVVLHNVGENGQGDNLVIRAMYFVPKPKNVDHVVVRVEASTVTSRDVLYCKGVGLHRKLLPFVPGFEIIGTIQTLGENARADGFFKEGDRVAGMSDTGGGNSRFISIPYSRLTKISPNVKSTSAVCLIHDYMAAFKALRLAKKHGSPFTGLNILVTDGFSPIGQAVITLANLEGANIYCTADESKHAYLATLGAKCFSMSPESWLPTASGTFDVVIDNTCVDSYSSSWFALNQKGVLVCVSPVYSFDVSYEGGCGILDFRELHNKWAGLKAKYMMTQTEFLDILRDCENDFEQYKQDLRYLVFLLERGDIAPKIAEKISLEDVPDAQRLLKSGRANGTIVCVPWIEG